MGIVYIYIPRGSSFYLVSSGECIGHLTLVVKTARLFVSTLNVFVTAFAHIVFGKIAVKQSTDAGLPP